MKSKKIVCILYSIVLIGMNVFGFAIFSNYRMTDKIFHKRVIEVQARQQELVNVSEVHKELLKFANQYHVTIMKYEFLNEKELSIYTTNQQEVLNMKFPYTTWKINVYPFKDLKNVGYGNTFFIDHTTRANTYYISSFSILIPKCLQWYCKNIYQSTKMEINK